jgi:hypothetical protein
LIKALTKEIRETITRGVAVVHTAVYVWNKAPTKSIEGSTPFEVWYRKKASVQHLHTFGCMAYVRNTKPHLSKLEDHGCRKIFIGYEQGTKGYRVYDPVSNKVHIAQDVVFDEGTQWDWDKEVQETSVRDGMFTMEYMVMSSGSEPVEHVAPDAPSLPAQFSAGAAAPLPEDEGDEDSVQPLSPFDSDRLDADHDDAPLRLRSMDSILG